MKSTATCLGSGFTLDIGRSQEVRVPALMPSPGPSPGYPHCLYITQHLLYGRSPTPGSSKLGSRQDGVGFLARTTARAGDGSWIEFEAASSIQEAESKPAPATEGVHLLCLIPGTSPAPVGVAKERIDTDHHRGKINHPWLSPATSAMASACFMGTCRPPTASDTRWLQPP